jgi:hypothetical protein
MEPKCRITRAVGEVGSSISSDCVGTAEMDPEERASRLHAVLEGGDGGVIGDEVDDFGVGGLSSAVDIYVATETAGVIVKARGKGVWLSFVGEGLNGAEVDYPAGIIVSVDS